MGMEVANTIRDQIGGKAFYMMGAKNLSGDEKSLSFKVMRNAKSVTHVVVTLTDSDLYHVEFVRCNTRAKVMRKTVSEIDGVYFDMLHGVIESGTGLALRLF